VNVVDEVIGVMVVVVVVVVVVGVELVLFFLLYDAALACRLGELTVAPKLF
jgi:hypothetical protein